MNSKITSEFGLMHDTTLPSGQFMVKRRLNNVISTYIYNVYTTLFQRRLTTRVQSKTKL